MTGDNSGDDLARALSNAALTIEAIYEWVDRVEKAGGTTCMEGVAAAHAMMKSLKKNRARISRLVLEPARQVLRKPEFAAPVGPAGAQKTRPTRGRRPGTKSVVDEAR